MKNRIRDQVQVVAEPWRESPYYSQAENWTFIFWGENTVFRQLFDQLDLASVLELACGWGRHAEQCIDSCRKMVIMDVFEENLEKTSMRLEDKGAEKLKALLGDGFSFQPVGENELTAIYCYDAMVHFSPDIVESYLMDAKRV